MTVDQFVGWIRRGLEVGKDFPVRLFCKNTEPAAGELQLVFMMSGILSFQSCGCNNFSNVTDALMSSIDEKNKDDDGFLRVTYSGVERAM